MVYQNKACRGIFGSVSGWGEMQGTENENEGLYCCGFAAKIGFAEAPAPPKIGFAEAPAPQPSSNKFGTVFGLIGAVAAPRQKRRKSSAMTELVREWPKRSPFPMQSKPKLRLALRSACTFVAAPQRRSKIGFAEAPAPQPSSNKFGTVFGLIGAVAAPRQSSSKLGFALGLHYLCNLSP